MKTLLALIVVLGLAGCSDDGPAKPKDCKEHCIRTLAGKVLRGPAEGPADKVAFTLPKGVAVGKDGRIFVADAGANQIRVLANGQVTALAGTGERGSADGPAAKAQFAGPSALALGPDGTLYVADQGNHRIRTIVNGAVATLAGAGGEGFADGPAATARFNRPCGVAVAADGAVLVADLGNHRIRRIARGQVTTAVGGAKAGTALGKPLETALNNPHGVAVEADGGLLIADLGNQRLLRWKGDAVTLIAGAVQTKGKDKGKPLSESKDGPLAEAGFSGPVAVLATPKGIYVSDWWGHRVRVIRDGKVETVVGAPKEAASDERSAEGPLAEGIVKSPFGLAVTADGHLVLADSGNRRICVLDP